MSEVAASPGFDPELAVALVGRPPTNPLDSAELERQRPEFAPGPDRVQRVAEKLGILVRDVEIEVAGGTIPALVASGHTTTRNAPAMLTLHGGGIVMGNRFLLLREHRLLNLVAELGAVVVSPDYRLAPEHPAPIPHEDCYATLAWMAANASALGIDSNRIIVAGSSGGGGLAAGVALMSRERGGPSVLGQQLLYPMLDDRNDSPSARQHTHAAGTAADCGQETVAFVWDAILGAGHAGRDHDPWVVPGRCDDLSGLPPAYVEVGSAEPFRDECVSYASRLWASGVQAELHVWPGAYHGFDLAASQAELAQAAQRARRAWIDRLWGIRTD